MYRADRFDQAPDSIAAFWEDESLSGTISLWDDKTNIYIVARLLFGTDVNVYDLSDDQLAAVRDKLIALKPHIRKFWSTAGELVNLYANGEPHDFQHLGRIPVLVAGRTGHRDGRVHSGREGRWLG